MEQNRTESALSSGENQAQKDAGAALPPEESRTPESLRSASPKPKRGYSYLLMAAHLCDDLNQGALVAVMPFLVLHNGYSYVEVTALLLAANAASAIIQPLFGWLGDRTQRPWLMALGITLAGIGIAGIGILPNYPLIVASAIVSGIGVAMFHPEGGRLANLVAGQQKGTGISIFAVGGKLGFTFGPLAAAAALGAFGMAGTLVFIVPSAGCALVLLAFNRTFLAFGAAHKAQDSDTRDDWKGFAVVMGAISVRSIMYYALLSFIPLFLVANLGQSEQFSTSMLSVFAIICAVATISSGWIGARTGAKALIIGSYALVAVEVLAFAFNGSLPVALVLIVLLALCCDISYPSAVALGQSFVPHHLGMASGISFGVMVCIGGMMSPVLGALGDACGLQAVMVAVAAIALVGIGIALAIPKNRPMR